MGNGISISEYRELKELRRKCKEQELELNLLHDKIRILQQRLDGLDEIIDEPEETSEDCTKTTSNVILKRIFDDALFHAQICDGFLLCETENINIVNDPKTLESIGYKIVEK